MKGILEVETGFKTLYLIGLINIHKRYSFYIKRVNVNFERISADRGCWEAELVILICPNMLSASELITYTLTIG